LIISIIVLFLASYISLYGVIPIVGYKYKVTVIDSIYFLASYTLIQVTLVLFTTSIKNRLMDIGISIIAFTVVNIWFSYAGVGHMLALHKSINNNGSAFTNPQEIACFAILLALFIDIFFINIYHSILMKYKDFWINNSEKILKETLRLQQIKDKAEAKETAKKKAVALKNDLVIAEHESA